MLSIRTKATEWATANIEFDDGTTTDNYTLTKTSLYESMVELIAWADAVFAPTFGWSWSAVADGRALITLTATAGVTMVCNSAAQTVLGFDASYSSDTSHDGSAGAEGTVEPGVQLSVRQTLGVLDDEAPVSGTGAARVGVPGLALQPVRLDTVLTATECEALRTGLAAASNPRFAFVYQDRTATWVAVALAGVTQSRTAHNLWRTSLEAVGGVS